MNSQNYSLFLKRVLVVLFLLCLTTLSYLYLEPNNMSFLSPSSPVLGNNSWPFLIEPQSIVCNSLTPPVLLIIVKSAVYEFEERATIRNTWVLEAKSLSKVEVVFSVGYSNNASINESLSNESAQFGDILQCDFQDSYHILVQKSYCNVEWFVRRCSRASYVFFTDSDVIVFPRNLLKMAQEMVQQSNRLVGHCWLSGAAPVRDKNSKSYMSFEAWPRKFYPPYCSGTGYLMTGDVPGKLLNAIPEQNRWEWAHKLDHLEDVVFTGYLRELAKVDIVHTNNIWYYEVVSYNLCDNKTISIHSFRPALVFMVKYQSFMKIIQNCGVAH